MDIRSAPVMAYRWTTFLLAGGYCLHQLLTQDHSSPGGPFRYLTIWALFLSFYSASRMLARSEGRATRRHHRTAAVAAVVNAMVVLLCWRVVVTDPALVGIVDMGGQIPWHQQVYLHTLGPGLQIFDALFIARVFGRPWRVALPLLGFLGAYLVWADLALHGIGARLEFYGTNILLALVVLAGLAGTSRLMRRRSEQLPSQPSPR